MAALISLNRELAESGEFVATQGLAAPQEPRVVRGLKEGMPITDGIFPESKEFLLGTGCRRVDAGAGLRDRRPDFSRAGSRRSTDQHADRSPAVGDPRPAIVECTGFRAGRRRLTKYIVMMHGKKGAWDEYTTWSKEDLEHNLEFMQRFNKELHESGVLLDTKGLALPQDARIVRAGNDGERVTDGVFPEAKEFLAGYWIVDVESPEQAYEVAAVHRPRPGRAENRQICQLKYGRGSAATAIWDSDAEHRHPAETLDRFGPLMDGFPTTD